MIEPYNKGKNKRVMVWACFGGNGRKSDLVFMPGDPEADRGGVTAAVYIKVLGRIATNALGTGSFFHAR
jgi:hypothetical protein